MFLTSRKFSIIIHQVTRFLGMGTSCLVTTKWCRKICDLSVKTCPNLAILAFFQISTFPTVNRQLCPSLLLGFVLAPYTYTKIYFISLFCKIIGQSCDMNHKTSTLTKSFDRNFLGIINVEAPTRQDWGVTGQKWLFCFWIILELSNFFE